MIEQLRQSVAILTPRQSASALSREEALELFTKIELLREQNLAYGHVVVELRRLLDELDRGSKP